MKAWRMRGWSSSQDRVLLLSWLERLSVMITIWPRGFASSACRRNRW